MTGYEIHPIARIRSDFSTKFGIPRQSGIVEELRATVVFEPEYRNPDALRGIDGFSHLWLIWQFSKNLRAEFSPTVRPPRLGGNVRMGVFATRSPFRPNALGLSCVKLEEVRETSEGTVLIVSGADLMDGTPIFDIKPYIPYSDRKIDALSGFAPDAGRTLDVVIPTEFAGKIPSDKLSPLRGVLANDPRPGYQNDEKRVYAMEFGGMEIKFSVSGGTLTVCGAEKIKTAPHNTAAASAG